MNEKLSFQNIIDTLAQKSGVSKKVADGFCKSFFDTVVDAFAQGEDVVAGKVTKMGKMTPELFEELTSVTYEE